MKNTIDFLEIPNDTIEQFISDCNIISNRDAKYVAEKTRFTPMPDNPSEFMHNGIKCNKCGHKFIQVNESTTDKRPYFASVVTHIIYCYLLTEEEKKKLSSNAKELWSIIEYRKKQEEKAKIKYTHYVRSQMSKSRKMLYKDIEFANRMKKILKEATSTQEFAKKISDGQKKRFENPEARQKSSKAAKKRYANPEERKKSAERAKKALSNLEIKNKMSQSQKNRFKNPNERKKISNKLKGVKHSEERKKKTSNMLRERYKNPDARLKMSESQKKRYKNNDAKLRHQLACKASMNSVVGINRMKKLLEKTAYKLKGLRYIRNSKKSPKELAKMFDVYPCEIVAILNYKKWGNIE